MAAKNRTWIGSSPVAFIPPAVTLPPERLDVARDRRERAALLVLGIGRFHTPEDLAAGASRDALEAFGDDLERDEALAHVDLLLEVLLPRLAVVR